MNDIERRQCFQKVKYFTRKDARRAAKAMRQKRHEAFVDYRCLCCDFYHVGHIISIARAEFLAEALA